MKSKDIPHISPQSAMDDYFKDMFGQANEDPLKKLEAQEQALQTKNTNIIPADSAQAHKLKKEVKPQNTSMLVTDFADPEAAIGSISPLIIPAAFPKLAPAAVKVETKVATKPKQEVSGKLDKKTALAILLKQKSSLSKAQRLRLKEKLKQLEEKQKPVSASPRVVQPVDVEAPIVKTAEPVQIEARQIELPTNTATLESTASAVRPSEKTQPAEPKIERPTWSERRFECLLFSVAGLKLAVPLISLGAIYKIEKEFTPLVGRASWFMGLYHHLDRNVRVVDTAQWVMPERCNQQVRDNYKFIIRLGSSDWGMACDAVHQSIQLYPDQVKWRSERTKRVWLYGTVIDHMCALIDADALNTLLERQAPINISH